MFPLFRRWEVLFLWLILGMLWCQIWSVSLETPKCETFSIQFKNNWVVNVMQNHFRNKKLHARVLGFCTKKWIIQVHGSSMLYFRTALMCSSTLVNGVMVGHHTHSLGTELYILQMSKHLFLIYSTWKKIMPMSTSLGHSPIDCRYIRESSHVLWRTGDWLMWFQNTTLLHMMWFPLGVSSR